ncbi:hypothetical protein [Candidatus Enterococcus mansonii]|uniref:hypothetical protein n=1 Tax=Candidatus Enterococcus mansonii TaxID=1834181 RepID=UPI000A33A438
MTTITEIKEKDSIQVVYKRPLPKEGNLLLLYETKNGELKETYAGYFQKGIRRSRIQFNLETK